MESQTIVKSATGRAIAHLNALLRGELSAVETFQHVIAKFGTDAPFELGDCLRSHQVRVEKLSVRISDLGGQPADGSGLWGSIARLFEGSASLFGRKSALAALEEGEDHGLAQYRALINDLELDASSRRLLEIELQPEQRKTHDTIRELCRACTEVAS